MSDSFIGEIKMFAATFSPRQWAFCNGAIMAVSQNESLFALIGATYGGDGRSSFGLPEMRGRIPVHYGQGPGLSAYPIGMRRGLEEVVLSADQLPSHTHALQASNNRATSKNPNGNVFAASPVNETMYIEGQTTGAPQALNEAAVDTSGSNDGHMNIMPYTAIQFIICLEGIFPSRN